MYPSLSEFSTLVTGEIARGARKIVINFGGVDTSTAPPSAA